MCAFIDNHHLLQYLCYYVFKISERICYECHLIFFYSSVCFYIHSNIYNVSICLIEEKISTGPGSLVLHEELRPVEYVNNRIIHLSCNNFDPYSHVSGGLQGYFGVFSVWCYGKLLLALS